MKKLGFIGAGNMAEALARGLRAGKVFVASDLIASDVDPARRRRLAHLLKIRTTADNDEVASEARAIVIAVKPQTIDTVLDGIAAGLRARTADAGKRPTAGRGATAPGGTRLYISIAAGVPIARLQSHLEQHARVIRVMPNAPAMVGQGMAALVRGPHASKADEVFALKLFRAVGDAIALKDETLLDAVTALSGSGPAYVYLFVKALADAGASEGLPMELAIRMALQTLRGAEANMRQSPLTPAELIRIVASPGGTTEAALRRFAEAGFSDIVASALHAAADRSRVLARSG